MNATADPQIAALAWVVLAGLVFCVVAIVLLLRSGRSVPPTELRARHRLRR